jgi:hypothetical protein
MLSVEICDILYGGTSHLWLFKWKIIKIKQNSKFSFSFPLAMFQELRSHSAYGHYRG